MNKISQVIVMIFVLVNLCFKSSYGAENLGNVMFLEKFENNITEFLPDENPLTNHNYPAWEFYSPSLGLVPPQQCGISISGGYLNILKKSDKPITANYGEAVVAKRSLLINSANSANLKGKYSIEFTIQSKNGTTDGLGFQILSNQGTVLIDGLANNSQNAVEITRGDGNTGRQNVNSIPYPMPSMGRKFNDIDVTLKLEIDTRSKTFRYYQSNINNGEAISGIDGNIDRLLASQDEIKMNLGFIKFAPRNNLPLNSIWMLKGIKLTELFRENVFKISPTEFYRNSVGTGNKITEINSNGENFSKLFSVINIENLTEIKKNVVAIMAHYDSDNKLSRLSDVKQVTIPPQNISRIELYLNDVYFNDKNAKTKVFLIEGVETIKPIENAMQIAITDLPKIRDRLQVGIYSSSLNPNTVINELDQEGNFITVDYTLDDPAQGFGAEAALDKIKTMVCAYSSIGNTYYKNSILKGKIDLALSTWAENDYTCKTNWWYNEISVPKKMSDILIYNLPYTDYSDKLYEIAKRGLPNLSPDLPHGSLDTGANLIDKLLVGIKISVAMNDPQAIKTYVTELLDGELKIFPLSKEGIMQDGSFQQHSTLLYNGSYAVVFVNGVNKLLAYLQNTDYMVGDNAISTYTDFILDGQQYMFRDNTFDFSVAGRSISRKNAISTSVKNGVLGAVDLLLSLPLGYRQNELQTLRNNRLLGLDNQTNMAKHFWVSDFTVAHRPDYYVSVRGASSRVKKTEYMNGENSKGYFLADGSTTILKDGTEYENIYSVWDWNKIPGTTSVQVESIPIVGYEYGGSKFVGGLSNQNMAISAIKINNTRTDTQLNAKKAYFIFDEGFIALGNEINSNLQKEVITSLNQALLKGNIIYKDTSVKNLASNTLGQIQNVNWVLHDKTGYLFNIPKAITISNKVQTGKWSDINLGQSTELVSQNVFSLFLSHGTAPINGTYSYIVLPNTTQAYIENYMINPNIVEISNNSNNTSVWNKNKSTLGIVFWESGTCVAPKSITGHFEQINVISSQPCVAFIRRIDNGYELTVSDPTQELISIDIYINGKLTTINMPTGKNAGNSVTLNIYQ